MGVTTFMVVFTGGDFVNSISYELPVQTCVLLVVYNLFGQDVTLLVAQIQPAGRYSVIWDARNAQGVKVASGI